MALMADGVMSSKELLSRMSTGFNSVVDGCKNEVIIEPKVIASARLQCKSSDLNRCR